MENHVQVRPEILFFDTSALLRLVFYKEPGSRKARQAALDCAPVFTSWVLVGEALGVLKHKRRKRVCTAQHASSAAQLSEDHYTSAVVLFLTRIESDFRIVDLATHQFGGVTRPVLEINQHLIHDVLQQHPDLDAADALQLALIRRGIRGLGSAKLVSADAKLIEAAEKEGIETVRVNKDE